MKCFNVIANATAALAVLSLLLTCRDYRTTMAQDAHESTNKTNRVVWLDEPDPFADLIPSKELTTSEQLAINQREMDRIAENYTARKSAHERLKETWIESVRGREQRSQEEFQHGLLAEFRKMNELQDRPDWRSTPKWPELPNPMETYHRRQTLWELQNITQELRQMRMQQESDDLYWRTRSSIYP